MIGRRSPTRSLFRDYRLLHFIALNVYRRPLVESVLPRMTRSDKAHLRSVTTTRCPLISRPLVINVPKKLLPHASSLIALIRSKSRMHRMFICGSTPTRLDRQLAIPHALLVKLRLQHSSVVTRATYAPRSDMHTVESRLEILVHRSSGRSGLLLVFRSRRPRGSDVVAKAGAKRNRDETFPFPVGPFRLAGPFYQLSLVSSVHNALHPKAWITPAKPVALHSFRMLF